MAVVETIICAAIWYKDVVPKRDGLPLRHYLPKNLEYGVVFCGHRHPHCMYTMVAVTGLASKPSGIGKEVQGFLTSENRFVDRTEGAKIHLANGGTLNYSQSTLYSEDLY